MSVPRQRGPVLPPQVLRLAADVQNVRDQLADAVDMLSGELAELAEQVEKLSGAVPDQAVRMWDWTSMNRQEAAAAWSTLLRWVSEVLVRQYAAVGDIGGRGKKIPACWYRHPDAVAELSWLCQEWLRLYRSGTGTPAGIGDWHDRWLPGVIDRLINEATTAGCTRGGHQRSLTRDYPPPDLAGIRAAVEADINARPPAAGRHRSRGR